VLRFCYVVMAQTLDKQIDITYRDTTMLAA